MTPTPAKLLIVGTALGLAMGLSACASGVPASMGLPAPITPTARYTLQVEPGLDRIALAVHDSGLSGAQQNALHELVGRFALSGAENLVVEAPSGGDPTAAAAAWSTRERLVALGIPAQRIKVVSYQAPNPKAPILAGFETVQAVVPKCGQAWGNLSQTGDNLPSSNFGCAVTSNLAAQVTNPRDLIAPRAMTAAEASRRTVVFDGFATGKATSSAQEALISSSSVSKAVE